MENQVLARLPAGTRAEVSRELSQRSLHQGERLIEQGARVATLFFPTSAVVSLEVDGGDGMRFVEVAMVGPHGLVGWHLLAGDNDGSPWRATVTTDGEALVMPVQAFRALVASDRSFRDAVGQAALGTLRQVTQRAACHRYHGVTERCAFWLLVVNGSVHTETIPVTHEFLASLLGVRRPSVTLALETLERSGAIDLKRGRITIVDRNRLRAQACDCFEVILAHYRRLREEAGR